MANHLFMDLGFPILLVDPKMIVVRGQRLPDVNMRELAEAAFGQLVTKPGRLTGAETRFIRKHLHMRQADFAELLNMANHSVVSQWESREDDATGMDYNTEVVLRVWMAAKLGQSDRVLGLMENALKRLDVRPRRTPLPIRLRAA